MNGPSDPYRASVYSRIEELNTVEGGIRVVTTDREVDLDRILIDIHGDIEDNVEGSDVLNFDLSIDEAFDVLTARQQMGQRRVLRRGAGICTAKPLTRALSWDGPRASPTISSESLTSHEGA